jgi:transcriptional regulator with XRE-family HTH domain
MSELGKNVGTPKRMGRPITLDLSRRAKTLGVSAGHLSRILSGERPSIATLQRIRELRAKIAAMQELRRELWRKNRRHTTQHATDRTN